MIIVMIPARMGSQRLTQKNLQKVGGFPLITTDEVTRLVPPMLGNNYDVPLKLLEAQL